MMRQLPCLVASALRRVATPLPLLRAAGVHLVAGGPRAPADGAGRRGAATKSPPMPVANKLLKPESMTFYSGNSGYYDILIELRTRLGADYWDKVRTVQLDLERLEEYSKLFMKKEPLVAKFGLQITDDQYNTLLHHLIATYEANGGVLCPLLTPYSPNINVQNLVVFQPRKLDKDGVAHSYGRNRSSTAFTQTLRGTGEFKINGIDVGNYFNRRTAAEQAIFPLQAACAYDKYNIWVTAKGGGEMSQAKAVCVSVARGIAMHDNSKLQDLSDAKVIEIDRRKRERKKTGQPKARAKWRWVRR